MESHSTETTAQQADSHRVAQWGLFLAAAGVAVAVVAFLFPNAFGDPYSSQEDRRPYLAHVDRLCSDVIERSQARFSGEVDHTTYQEQADDMNALLQEWAAMPLPDQDDRELVSPALDDLETATLAVSEEAQLLAMVNENQTLGPHDEDMLDEAGDRAGEALESFRSTSRAYGLTVCPGLGR